VEGPGINQCSEADKGRADLRRRLHKLEPKELSNVPADEVLKTLQDSAETLLNAQLKLFAA
jgi:hypothetical protein